jgi:4-aminobutyrate aminotransferase/(S)-3-amino-2-methylpropionate transaminase
MASEQSPVEHSRHLSTPIPGPRSNDLMARKSSAVSAGVATTLPVFAARAAGGIIEDVDGNRLIDLGSGIAVTTVGSSARRVVEAVSAQAAAFTHTCFMVTPYEGYVAVAEHLARLTPGDHEKRSALFNSGSEAVENAVKIARSYTGRNAVVVFDHAYHGRTNLTMAMTAKSMPYKKGFGPFAGEVYRVPTSYPFRDAEEIDGKLAAERAVALIEAQVGADQVAAVVIEPIQGEGGFIVPAPGFLAALADWCRLRGAVFVVDEVQTGFGRTGAWFAVEHEDVTPDLIATAKGIAGGLPLSAVTGRAEIMDSVHAGGLGGTYGGNPLACAAALAVIETIETDGLLQRAREIEAVLFRFLRALQDADPRVGDVRGRGAMVGVELIDPLDGRPDGDLAKRVASFAHGQGVLALTCGTSGNVIRFLPPLSISDELLVEGLEVVAQGLRSVL